MAMTSGTLLILCACWAAIAATTMWRWARKQRDWHQVEGVVLSSSVHWGGGTAVPDIHYEYTYEGRKFRADRFRSFELHMSFGSPSRDIVARYPVGKSVRVYVNPKDPYFSVLVPGGDPKGYVFIGVVAAVICLIGLRMQ
jgi:hypothetical protein